MVSNGICGLLESRSRAKPMQRVGTRVQIRFRGRVRWGGRSRRGHGDFEALIGHLAGKGSVGNSCSSNNARDELMLVASFRLLVVSPTIDVLTTQNGLVSGTSPHGSRVRFTWIDGYWGDWACRVQAFTCEWDCQDARMGTCERL